MKANRNPMRSILSSVSILLVILSLMFSQVSPQRVLAQSGDGLKREVNAESGRVSYISPLTGRSLPASRALGTGIRPQDPAMALARRYAPEFGIKDPERELVEMKSDQDEAGHLVVRYQQNYQDVPVMGGELIINTNEQGDLYSMSGEVSRDLSLSTQPAIDAAQAKETAIQSVAKWYGKSREDLTSTEPALWIYDESLLQPSTRPVELVWRMEVTTQASSAPIRELVLVNAQRGGISLHFNQIDTAGTAHAQAAKTAQDVPPTATPVPTETPLPPVETPVVNENPVATEVPSNSAGTVEGSVPNSPDALAATTWYVATTGNDANSCTSTGSPCATINGAIGKAAASGDTIKVAIGTYTGSGTEVVLINKSVTLSGGWNTSFTTQSGMSMIDGQATRQGIVISGITVSIDHFNIQNGTIGIFNNGGSVNLNSSAVAQNTYSGIQSYGTMTIDSSLINANKSSGTGGGIYSSGTMTINSTVIRDNGSSSYGGGIDNEGTMTLNNSSVIYNKTNSESGGGILNRYLASLTLNNSTISGNSAQSGGGGIINVGTLYLNNVTISNNTANNGGGLNMNAGSAILQNTIIAGNTANSAPDCSGTVVSSGYNLVGNTSGCMVTGGSNDEFNVNPLLSTYPIGTPGYHALLSGSPAIDAGNPATCLSTDQRGVSRPQGVKCDIGAYEYTTPGSAASFGISAGSSQRIAPLTSSAIPLVVYVVDSLGSPVSGVNVTFTSPASGPSGTFANTGTNVTSVSTNNSGVAVASTFTANNQLGSYNVNATASGLAGSVNFVLTNVAWFVATTGNDSNSCSVPASPCLTINGAIGKAVSSDTIVVAIGTYTGSGTEVVLIDKSVTLSGGWNAGFTSQIGVSNIDGQTSRRGITVGSNITTTVERFSIQNGSASDGGGIISNGGSALTLTGTTVKSNTAAGFGGGIFSVGNLTINNSTINGNTTTYQYGASGGGIRNHGTLTLNNSTVSGNSSAWNSGGIYNEGVVTISNSTISNNSASTVGGIWNIGGILNLRNSILANNTAGGASSNCSGISSLGNNLVDNNSGCAFTSTTGDKVGTSASPINPRLTSLQDNGGPTFTHALMAGSPAIDAGNPAAPGSGGNACLSKDQRGVARPGGAKCDIGAYEGSVAWVPSPLVSTYTTNNTSTLPGTFLCNQSDPGCGPGDSHAKATHAFAIGTYNLFATKHNRDSIDNNGMTITSTVHYCDPNFPCPLDNAYWTGTQMVYGGAHGYPLADDIVAHELTHGVTQYESNLFYYYQSGAINESFSDLWGEYYDQTNGLGNDATTVKWIIGEGISGYPIPAGFTVPAIRSMSNPPALKDPDKMSSSYYYEGQDDNGGVHWNSGINNKAVYLMVNGGTFNTKTVTALGWGKTAAIYYEVNTHLLTSGADYSDLYYALQQACASLIGKNGIIAANCSEVKDAIDAVEMNSQPASGFNADAPLCITNKPVFAFRDDLETRTTNWTFTNGSYTRWQYDSPYGQYAQSGSHFLYADDVPQNQNQTTDARAMLKSFVVPKYAYLWFAQAYDFEYDASGYYDGGVLEYSTNGGSTWTDAGSLMEINGYKGKIYSTYINPLKGRSAFVGSSHGYISTRLNLSTLAQKTVTFRWRMGLDDGGTAWGWWLDNIKLYTCSSASSFADVPPDHPYYQYIEILYANGLTGGCATAPLKFCPDQIMDRAQAAVFMLRGNFGSSYVPPVPTHIFQDDWSKGTWAEGWAEGMRKKGLSAGCSASPLKYCPWDLIPREQAVIFALRMKYGTSYVPPPAKGTVFADMTDTSYYATAWAEQAYKDELISSCGMSGGKPKICPKDLVSRGLAAYMIVRAKNLTMP